MKFKKLFLVGVILLTIILMGAVSAQDNLTVSDDFGLESLADDVSIELGCDLDNLLEKSDDANLSAGKGNVKELDSRIEKAKKNSEIKLTKGYDFSENTDSYFEDGIEIDKVLTINGNGHTINGRDNTIFLIREKNVVLKNIHFKNTGIDIYASDCSILNCSFSNSYVYTIDDNCNIADCNFTGYYSGYHKVISSYDDYLNVVNCNFKNCNRAVYSKGDYAKIEDCSFSHCSAKQEGGAVYSGGSNCSVVSCSFKDCWDGDGNAIYFNYQFKLINSSFENGAWYSEDPGIISNVLVDNVSYDGELFANLKANQCIVLKKDYCILSPIALDEDNIIVDGGGNYLEGKNIFYITAENVTIMNCNFKNCNRTVYSKGNYSNIVNCNFIGCSFKSYGILYFKGNYNNLINCSFMNSSNQGRVVYFEGSYDNLVNCSFMNSVYSGGAVYFEGSYDNLVNCSFMNCSAYRGGAVYFEGSYDNLINCDFMYCFATYGGAVYSEGNYNVIGCSFLDCSDEWDDAIYSKNKFFLTNSTFFNCTWYCEEPGIISNVSLDNLEYDVSVFENLKDNSIIVLTSDYFIASPLLIDANNLVIDCGGNSISANGAFYITGENVTIMNGNFKRCFSNKNGSAVCSIGDNFKLLNCSFLKCLSKSHHYYWPDYSCLGSAVYAGGDNSSIVRCSFKDCHDDEDNAVYFGSNFNLIESSFINGSWYNDGQGYIFNVSVDNQSYDTDAFNNLKDGDRINITKDYSLLSPIVIEVNNIVIDAMGHSFTGDKIFNILGVNVTVLNCNFVNCSVGAIYIGGNHANIVNCSFENCLPERYETGYIYSPYKSAICSQGNYTRISDCSFLNSANVQLNGSSCRVVNCSFVKSEAYDHGGAICSGGVNCSVIGCSFENCRFLGDYDYSCKVDYGGAVYSSGDNFKFLNCSLMGCHASYGGALYSTGKNSSAADCIFVNCYTYGTRDCEGHFNDGGCGGAIYSSGVNCHILNSNFTKCFNDYCGYGGAVYLEGNHASIAECSFVNCSAKDGYYNDYYDDYYLSYGGTIYSKGKNCSISACSFLNSSAYCGGAIYSAGDKFSILNSMIMDCLDYNGVDIFTKNPNAKILNCTFLTPKIIASNLKMYYNDGSYFKVKVYKFDDSAASGVLVTFKLDDKKLKTVKTDKNGVAKVKITSLPKTYKISATALGVTVTKKLTVKKVLSLKKVKVKKSAKKLVLTATLKKVKGKYLKGKKITFKFNGKTYKAKTNKKGVAKVSIKKSVLGKLKVGKKVAYQATYVKSTVKYTVKVAK